MKLTGHKTEGVYRRYAIVSEADLKEGVAKLAKLHESQRGSSSPTVVPFSRLSSPARRLLTTFLESVCRSSRPLIAALAGGTAREGNPVSFTA